MKKIGILLLLAGLWGCEKSDIMLYEQNAAVYFESGNGGHDAAGYRNPCIPAV